MARDHTVDERGDLILLADVAGHGLAAAALGLRSRLLERLGPAAAHNHLGAERRQLEGARSAETGSCAADDRHLAVDQPRLEDARRHGGEA